MTIVLQHQYQDLKVDSKGFSITLSFNGRKENLYIPYCAVTSFADPSVQFGLQFREIEYDIDDSDLNMDPHDLTSVNEKAKKETSKQNESTSAKVISFESIRKQSKTKLIMKNNKYELIIFDCDGTLIDSESTASKAVSQVLQNMGYENTRQSFVIKALPVLVMIRCY